MGDTSENLHLPSDVESLCRNICDLSPDGIIVVDRDYTVLYANKPIHDLVQLSHDKVVNHTLTEVMGSEAAFELIKPKLDRCFTGEVVMSSNQVYLANSIPSLLHISHTPCFNAEGEATHAVVVMRKSDQYFQDKSEVGINQSQLSRSLASSPQPIVIASLKDGQIHQINDAGINLLGYEPHEIIGQRVKDYALNLSFLRDLANKLDMDEPCKIDEIPVRHKNGSVVHIEVVLNNISFNGSPAVMGFCRDRSDELLALKTVNDKADTLRLLRTIAETANEASDIESAITVCLKEVCKFTRWPIGHALLFNEEKDALQSSGIWHTSKHKYKKCLKELAGKKFFVRGKGLPGMVMKNSDAVYIPNLVDSKKHPIGPRCLKIRIKSALAFPILTGDKIAGVLEFFSPDKGEMADNLFEVLKPVGVQLGRVIERQQAEESLHASREHYKDLVDDIEAIVWEIKLPEEVFTFVSASAEKILGYTPEEWYQTNFWTNHIHPEDREEAMAFCFTQIAAGKDHSFEYRMIAKDGSVVWLNEVVHVMLGEKGKPIGLRGVMFDITSHKSLSEQLEYQASHDNLTSLYNRNIFERRLAVLLSSDPNRQHAVCYLDLDQFKVINDACGHLAGDTLLHQLGTILKTRLRSGDTLARLGGDEFGILIEDCSIENAYKFAEQILKLIQDFRFTWEHHQYNIGASIGLVPIDSNSGTLTEIMSAADMACYAAKDAGRNRIRIYHQDDQEMALRRREMDWVGKINKALEENRFLLYTQPITALQDTQQGNHFEILLRMIGEEGEIIAPGAFLPAAERYGISTKIDRWVISKALHWLNQHPSVLKTLPLFTINLSGHSLVSSKFLKFLLETLNNSTVPCHKICFEITETAVISNLARAKEFIETLKEAGCMFALDDFGSGLSSFNYLKNLPVDYLKIDGAFVVDIVTDPIDFELVRSINEIGHVMNKKTIAEFVESEDILNALKRLGVDYAQGYHIGKPLPLYKRPNVIPISTDKTKKARLKGSM